MRADPSESLAPPAGRAGEPGLLRRLNLSAAMRAFLDAGSLTVSELQSDVGVSRPTAEELLNALIADGFVRQAPSTTEAQRRTGRPARRWELVAERYAVVGVDIGAHKVAVVTCDLRGDTVSVCRRTVDPLLPAHERLKVAARLIKRSLRQAGVSDVNVQSVTCGITGIINTGSDLVDIRRLEAGKDLHVYALPGFDEIDVLHEVSVALGREIQIANDTHLAAVAEQWRGAAHDALDLVYMHAGRRLGAAIILNGQVHAGRHGLAASIGAMRILGWADVMERLDEDARTFAASKAPQTTTDPVKALFAAAAEGHEGATRTVDAVARALALGASTLVHALDPDVVVLGGGLSRAGAVFAEPFRSHLAETSINAPEVRLSALGEEAVALGAARRGLDELRSRLLA